MKSYLLKPILFIALLAFPILILKIPAIKRVVDRLEVQTIDWRFRLRGTLAPSDRVVIFDLDDQTLNRYPLALSRRSELSKVISMLKDAKVLGIDLLFHDQENLLDQRIKQRVKEYLDHAIQHDTDEYQLLNEIFQELIGDELLEKSLANAQVLLVFYFNKENEDQVDQKSNSKYLARGKFGQIVLNTDPPPFSGGHIVHSIDQFQAKAKNLGYALTLIDSDGVARESTSIYQFNDQQYIPFAFQAIALYEGISRAHISYDFNQHQLSIKDKIWQFQGESFFINYRGPAKTIPTYSVADLLDQKLSNELWKDKIVILSKSYLQKDRLHTPFDRSLPGAELQANIIEQLLSNDMIYRLSPVYELLICFLFLFLSMIDVLYFKRFNGFILIFILWVIYLLLSILIFNQYHFLIPIISTSLCLLLFWCIGITMSLFREIKLKLKIKNSFNKYISTEVLNEIMKDDKFEIINQSAEITILFSDIRRFTQYSEDKTAQQLSILLNRYFEPMTTAVLDHRGTVDKFIGDAIMAFFGMPVKTKQHREQALDCVIQMHQALMKLQPEFEKESWILEIGIGLNTGIALVGNLGSTQRLSYTAIGDSVNLASRIESLSSTYQLFCIVGESVLHGINLDQYRFRDIDLVRVKGKKEGIILYEFLGHQTYQIKVYEQIELFEQGIRDYRLGHFEESKKKLATFALLNPKDHVVEIYLKRLDQLLLAPPSYWDGVFKYESKS